MRREARGASVIYLPPYSPVLDPIEQAFAKLKALLRGIAARTVSVLWDALGESRIFKLEITDRVRRSCRPHSTRRRQRGKAR